MAKKATAKTDKVVKAAITAVNKLDLDPKEKLEAINELDDLLSGEEEEILSQGVEIEVTENQVAQIKPASKEKKLVGVHPITGEEVWI